MASNCGRSSSAFENNFDSPSTIPGRAPFPPRLNSTPLLTVNQLTLLTCPTTGTAAAAEMITIMTVQGTQLPTVLLQDLATLTSPQIQRGYLCTYPFISHRAELSKLTERYIILRTTTTIFWLLMYRRLVKARASVMVNLMAMKA